MGTELPAGPLGRPFLRFGRAGGAFWGKDYAECSCETNMYFQHSILTSTQSTAIIICSHFITVVTLSF